MSDIERLVLEKHQLLGQVDARDRIIATLVASQGGFVSLPTRDVEAAPAMTVEQTKTRIRITVVEDGDGE